eukprot:2083682-Amphidinium_carterae.1
MDFHTWAGGMSSSGTAWQSREMASIRGASRWHAACQSALAVSLIPERKWLTRHAWCRAGEVVPVSLVDKHWVTCAWWGCEAEAVHPPDANSKEPQCMRVWPHRWRRQESGGQLEQCWRRMRPRMSQKQHVA